MIAFAVTTIAAIALLALGLVLQLMTYELFESYSQYPLPSISKPLFENFGYRPTAYLIHTTFWLWWLYLWAGIHTHFYYANNAVFARVYAFRLLLCCAVTVLYVALFAILAAVPRILLLADLSHEPSTLMKSIPVVSKLIPLVFLGLAARWAYQTTTVIRNKDGGWTITHIQTEDE